jgi:hypothetical protein
MIQRKTISRSFPGVTVSSNSSSGGNSMAVAKASGERRVVGQPRYSSRVSLRGLKSALVGVVCSTAVHLTVEDLGV